MSQYPPPPPYGPPGPLGYQPYRPYPDRLAPAKRSAILLWIIGGLMAFGCGCLGVIVWTLPLDQLVAQIRTTLTPSQLSQLQGVSLEQVLRIGGTVLSALGVVAGLVMSALAFFVRRGSRGASITALILAGAMGLWCALSVLGNAVQAIGGTVQAVGGLVIWLIISGVVALLITFLIQALGASRYRRAHPAAGQQYWQMQQLQNELGPGQGGYGYGSPPPSPPAQTGPGWTVPPPPAPPPPPPPGDPPSNPPGA